MSILVVLLASLIPPPAHAASRFDYVGGQRKLVCTVYDPSGLQPVYVQAPRANAPAKATHVVAYRKSFAETVYLGMEKVNDDTLRGPDDSWLLVTASEENTEDEFRAEFGVEGRVYQMLCQRSPERTAAPL